MQHSQQVLFCDICGLANEPEASHCAACQHPLVHEPEVSQPVAPVTIASTPVIEVTPGASSAAASDFLPGAILAERYQVEEEIGRGGFSIVYRARNLQEKNRSVAIKRIPISALTPRQVIDATETFNREILMLTRFAGRRGIPAIYEHLTDPENWYLVMEYIPGSTLEECLQHTPGGYLNEAKTLQIGIELAQILQELHTDHPPVVFRDVKPTNIMLTSGQKLFLIDFGIARTFTFGKTRDTTPLGSPGYAAPEQYGRAQTDRRTDIYGLGSLLQTLVTGRDPLELAAGESARNPQPPSPELRQLLDEMLALEPARRPVDMLHVQTRLQHILYPSTRAASHPITHENQAARKAILVILISFFALGACPLLMPAPFLLVAGTIIIFFAGFVLIIMALLAALRRLE